MTEENTTPGPKPLTTEDENGDTWVAIGLSPFNGHLIWVRAETEMRLAPIVDDEPEDEPVEATAEDDNQTKLILP